MSTPVSDAMAGMTPEQRAVYKAQQIAAITPSNNMVAGTRMVSCNDLVYVNGMLEFTVAMWGSDGMGGWYGVDLDAAAAKGEWGGNPVRVVNPPILVPDPGGDVERTFEDPITHVVTSTFYREDLDAALMQIALDVTERVTFSNEM